MMMRVISPTESPIWRALASEAGVASDQIGEGATLLSRLTPGYSWTFARAFFPLSIGIERACKLALQVDAKLESGSFLSEREMRAHGHGLGGLVDAVDAMNLRRGFAHSRPSEPIHDAILAVLTEFATNGRYHHLDNLAGRAGGADPSKMWWDTVIIPILEEHYKPSRRARDEAIALGLGSELDEFSVVRYAHVDGGEVLSMTDALRDGALMESATPWIRVYTLQIARWLAKTMVALRDVSHDPEVPDLWEFFSSFNVDEAYMKSRKTWRPLS